MKLRRTVVGFSAAALLVVPACQSTASAPGTVPHTIVLVTAQATTSPAPSTVGEESDGGWLAAPVSPFDMSSLAVVRLDPMLLKAVQDAAHAAQADGIDMRITSGWRSRAFQQQLLDQAVAKYGSLAVARQWVATPDESHHVLGKAVDISPPAADDWLLRNGTQYGLCQIYANEKWHFELATDPGGTCPPLLTDAAG